jgi:hypothetical protein
VPLPAPERREEFACTETVPHVGVLFVHGVGFQEAGETFSTSTEPLIRAIREGIPASENPLPDPVIRATSAFGDRAAPAAEVRVVVNKATQHWVMTEAWWATSFRPPSIGTMLSWLGPETAAARVARRIRWRPSANEGPEQNAVERATGYFETVMLSVVVSLTLLLYVVLRAVFTIVPIAGLRSVTIGGIDRLLTGWAGDMRVLLFDEAQSGMVRRQIGHSLEALEGFGCERVVVIAHSGGAVASYMTLTDPTVPTRSPASLVTFGSGLNIAWRLLGIDRTTSGGVARRVGGLLTQPLPAGIRWTDYWATDDPVPAGPMDDRPPDVVGPEPAPNGLWPGYRVSNFWNLRSDHGGYFDNDEEFVFPVMSEIHRVGRSPNAKAPFSESRRETLVLQRERRVSALLMWRQFVTGAAAFAILGSVAAGIYRWWSEGRFTRPVDDLTRQIGEVWAAVPGTDLLAGPVADMRALDWWPVRLVGFLLLPLLVVAIVWRLAPWASGWAHPWRDTWMEAAGKAFGWILFIGLAIVTLVAVPGLIGMGLSASPFWSWDPARFLAADVFRYQQGQNVDFLGDLAIHLVLTLVFIFIASFVALGVARGLQLLSRWPVALWLAGAIVAAIVIAAVFCVAFAVVSDSAFGVFMLGWAVVALAAMLLSRLGSWRWRSWDRQERWEARSDLQGASQRRRLGRGYDAGVFLLLGLGILAFAIVVAIRPLTDVFTGAGMGMGATYLAIAVLLGVSMDAVNGRQDLGGSAPTAASVAVAESSSAP